MKFSASGFKTEAQRGITLTVAASVSLDQTLRVGSITETVLVQSEVPAVQTSSSDISTVVNATTVRELPLNGRSWTDLAQLQAGVSAIHTQPDFSAGTDRGNRGFGQQLTISGARPQQNNYRLDGVSLNDYANGAPGSVLGGSLGVDAIQEFSVITSNYSAEYGKTSGGVVNAITRSGTNKIHGSAYEFLRNSRLDAKNYFDAGSYPALQAEPVWWDDRRPDSEGRDILLRRFRGHPAVQGHHYGCDRAVGNCASRQSLRRVRAGRSICGKYLTFYPLPDPTDRFRRSWNLYLRRPAGRERELLDHPCRP